MVEHRPAVSGDDVVDLEPADAELGEIVVEPAGEGRVHVGDRAVGLGGEEAGRRVVEIVDRVLKVLEEGLVPVVVARLVGHRPRHHRRPWPTPSSGRTRMRYQATSPSPLGGGERRSSSLARAPDLAACDRR